MLHHNCKNEIATANGGAACSKYVDYLWNEVEEEGWLFEVEKRHICNVKYCIAA